MFAASTRGGEGGLRSSDSQSRFSKVAAQNRAVASSPGFVQQPSRAGVYRPQSQRRTIGRNRQEFSQEPSRVEVPASSTNRRRLAAAEDGVWHIVTGPAIRLIYDTPESLPEPSSLSKTQSDPEPRETKTSPSRPVHKPRKSNPPPSQSLQEPEQQQQQHRSRPLSAPKPKDGQTSLQKLKQSYTSRASSSSQVPNMSARSWRSQELKPRSASRSSSSQEQRPRQLPGPWIKKKLTQTPPVSQFSRWSRMKQAQDNAPPSSIMSKEARRRLQLASSGDGQEVVVSRPFIRKMRLQQQAVPLSAFSLRRQ